MVRRVCITLEDELYRAVERAMAALGETNRSRFISTLVGEGLQRLAEEPGEGLTLVVLVYDHEVGEVAREVAEVQHELRDVIRATIHIHLDERNCAEVIHVMGKGERVRELVRRVNQLRRGLKYARVIPVPFPPGEAR